MLTNPKVLTIVGLLVCGLLLVGAVWAGSMGNEAVSSQFMSLVSYAMTLLAGLSAGAVAISKPGDKKKK